MGKEFSIFINYGIPSDLAHKLEALGITENALHKITRADLQKKYNLDIGEVEIVKSCIKRRPIPNEVIFELLEKNNFTCCICKGLKSDSYIIHHINGSKFKNVSCSDLAVLCPNDHDLAHKKGHTITRKLTRSQIVLAKASWEKSVKKQQIKAARQPHAKEHWNRIASKVACFTVDNLFAAHRGTLLFDENVTAVFVNDGYDGAVNNQKGKMEISLLRNHLKKYGLKEIGFGTSSDKYSWCALVKTKDVDFLHEIIWKCEPPGMKFSGYQKAIAFVKTSSYRSTPMSNYFL